MPPAAYDLLVKWYGGGPRVARPVAAATACLYAHGDGEPARALTCVSVLPPAAAAVAVGRVRRAVDPYYGRALFREPSYPPIYSY